MSLTTRRYRKPTIKEVAVCAGVSTTTVSEFVNGRTNVCSHETAERIRQAIAELHYVSGAGTRGRSQRATRTMGVCIARPTDFYGNQHQSYTERLWAGISAAMDTEDYSLLHYQLSVRESPDYRVFLDGRIDGLIMVTSHTDPRPAQIAAAGLPLVLLARFQVLPEGCGAVYACEDNTSELALSYLWNLGHRRIAHVAGPVDPIGTPTPEGMPYYQSDAAIGRREGYQHWLEQRRAYDPDLVFHANSWSAVDMMEPLKRWRALAQPPTAVFCSNDELAVHLIDQAGRYDWRVPETLAIIGVDNRAICLESVPPLTSIEIPAEQIGLEAVQMLQRLMQGTPAIECRHAIPVTKLVERASTFSRL